MGSFHHARATYYILRDGGVVEMREFIHENPRKMAQQWFEKIQGQLGECLLVVACKGL